MTEYALKSVAVQQFQNYVEAWQCPGRAERVPQSPLSEAETRRSRLGLTHAYSPLSYCTDRCIAATDDVNL